MNEIIPAIFGSYWALLPAFTLLALTVFFWVRWSSFRRHRRFREIRLESDDTTAIMYPAPSHRRSESEEPTPVSRVLQAEDVSLRLLEELHETSLAPHYFRIRSRDSHRLLKLEGIRNELQSVLRSSVGTEDFSKLRDRILGLLDELDDEMLRLQQKEPFSDIKDPEKSLLIDILQEIDPANSIVRQKAHQLGNLIKVKHQDLMQLQSENLKAAAWTRWGAAGTLFFGLLSITLSVLTVAT